MKISLYTIGVGNILIDSGSPLTLTYLPSHVLEKFISTLSGAIDLPLPKILMGNLNF